MKGERIVSWKVRDGNGSWKITTPRVICVVNDGTVRCGDLGMQGECVWIGLMEENGWQGVLMA